MINPVLKREIKSLLRTPKFFIGTGIYLLLLVVCVNIIILNMFDDYYGIDPENLVAVYYFMLGFQLMAIILVVPAVCGGSISGERERQTLDLILVTKMTPSAIIRGKIYSSLLTIALLIVASLPVYGILFYYGGISFLNFIINTFYSLVAAVVVASISVFASAKFKKTTTAMVFTYLLIFIYTCVFFLIILLLAIFFDNIVSDIIGFLALIFNPVVNFISLIDSQLGSNMSWAILEEFEMDLENSYVYIWHFNLIVSAAAVWILNRCSARAIDPLQEKCIKKR